MQRPRPRCGQPSPRLRHMSGPTRTEQRGQHSREQVLNAAETLMAARGYHSTSIADIIRESGVPSSSIYWHFQSKAGVLAAVMERGAHAFFTGISAAKPGADTDPRSSLEHVFVTSLEAVRANPSFLTLFLDFLLHFEDEPAVQERVISVRRAAKETVHHHIMASYAVYGEQRAARIADRVAPLTLAMFDGIFIALESQDGSDLDQAAVDAAAALDKLAESIP